MEHSKTARYIIAIVVIAILSLVILAFIPHDTIKIVPAGGKSGGGGSTSVVDPDPQEKKEDPKPDCCASKPQPAAPAPEPKTETPSAPAQELPNNQATPTPQNPTPTPIVNVTVPAPVVIFQPAPETPQQQMPTEKTYTIKKGDEEVKSSIPESEVRTFVSNLNNYVTWKNKAKVATIDELTEMLSGNGYTLSADN